MRRVSCAVYGWFLVGVRVAGVVCCGCLLSMVSSVLGRCLLFACRRCSLLLVWCVLLCGACLCGALLFVAVCVCLLLAVVAVDRLVFGLLVLSVVRVMMLRVGCCCVWVVCCRLVFVLVCGLSTWVVCCCVSGDVLRVALFIVV